MVSRKEAIVSISLGAAILVGGIGSYLWRRDAPLRESAAQLPALAASAREARLPFTAEDLLPAPPFDPLDNAGPDATRLCHLLGALPDGAAVIGKIEEASIWRRTDASAELKQMAEAFRLIETITAKPRLDFQRDWELLPLLPMLETTELRKALRLISARARIRSLGGDFDGAVADLERTFALAELIGQEPTLSASSLRVEGLVLAYTTVRRLATHWPGDAAKLAALRSTVADEPEFLLLEPIRGLQFMAVAYLRNAAFFADPPLELLSPPPLTHPNYRPPTGPPWLRREGLPTGLLERAALVESLRYFLAIARAFEGGVPKPFRLTLAIQMAEDVLKSNSSKAAEMVHRFSLGNTNILSYYRPEAQRQVTLGYLEALSTRAKTGVYPKYLEGSYPDPLGEGNVGYRLDDLGFRVWSVGFNLTDDGGRLRMEAKSGQGWDEVAPYPPRLPR
ncbi:MAG TPA: hypothetical protein PLL78_06540 [Fimbriimonadaceae bacterium]|nr:hypothetical protein [Fimbriimonadaceae bacterium]HRJ96326.1 hypothetical protein [Fimbriimonadaceae bacterium]